MLLGLVVQPWSPSTWEIEEKGSGTQGCPQSCKFKASWAKMLSPTKKERIAVQHLQGTGFNPQSHKSKDCTRWVVSPLEWRKQLFSLEMEVKVQTDLGVSNPRDAETALPDS